MDELVMNPVSHCLDQAPVSLTGLAAMSPSPHIMESQNDLASPFCFGEFIEFTDISRQANAS